MRQRGSQSLRDLTRRHSEKDIFCSIESPSTFFRGRLEERV